MAESRGYGAYRCLVAVNEGLAPAGMSLKGGKETSMPWLPRQLQVSCEVYLGASTWAYAHWSPCHWLPTMLMWEFFLHHSSMRVWTLVKLA